MNAQEESMLMLQAVRGKELADSFDLKLFSDRDEKLGTVHWVGEEEDRSAGIFGSQVSPLCSSSNEAYAWCYVNAQFLEDKYGDE